MLKLAEEALPRLTACHCRFPFTPPRAVENITTGQDDKEQGIPMKKLSSAARLASGSCTPNGTVAALLTEPFEGGYCDAYPDLEAATARLWPCAWPPSPATSKEETTEGFGERTMARPRSSGWSRRRER